MTRQTVKEARLYEENDNFYLDVRYEIEDQHSIKEIHIPKVRIPLEFASLEHSWESVYGGAVESTELVLPCKNLSCYPGRAYFVNSNGHENVHPGKLFATKIIKEKKTDMTIEEIEAKLGYKIRIVNKKEE